MIVSRAVSKTRSKFGIAAAVALLFALAACSMEGSIDVGLSADNSAPRYVAAVPADFTEAATSEFAAANDAGIVYATSVGTSSTASQSSNVAAFLTLDEIPLGTMSAAAGAAPVVVEVDGVVFELNVDRFVASAELEALGNSTVWADSNAPVRADGNSTVWADGRSTVWADHSDTFWADGRSTVWADGRSTVWADGNSTVWADGRSTVWADDHGYFTWMPPNSDLWHRVNLRGAHDAAPSYGHDVVVAVVDTGVDMTHPLLAGSLSADGWDFVDNDADPDENGSGYGSYGHGTSVAGIVRQIAPRATILPIRVLEADGSGDVLDVVRGVYYAVDQGADIINLSLGSREESPALTQALEYAASRDVFVTTTAGNANQSGLNYPAALAHRDHRIFSVTSVDLTDNKSVFSNYDYTAEIAAPGEFVYGPYPGGGLAAWSGTSMSAPVVAGAVALALGEDRLNQNGNWTVRFSKRLSEQTVANIYRGNLNADYRNQLGNGRLDIEGFLDRALR